MNAIKFLLQEHKKVKTVLADIDNDKHKFSTRQKMLKDLCHELKTHEKMEETVPSWYPSLKKNEKLADVINHLLEEENDAKKTMKEFDKIIDDEEKFNELFKEFKKNVEHHAGEEEKKLFPQVEKILSESELDDIGKEMREFKKTAMGAE